MTDCVNVYGSLLSLICFYAVYVKLGKILSFSFLFLEAWNNRTNKYVLRNLIGDLCIGVLSSLKFNRTFTHVKGNKRKLQHFEGAIVFHCFREANLLQVTKLIGA